MQYRVKEIVGRTLIALDGEVGKVADLYFDDDSWTVRYLVVDTGTWLSSRKVLISPQSLEPTPPGESAIRAKLTRDQVENSPPSETHKPVSRQHEEELAAHYGYPTYWFEAGFSGTGLLPIGEVFREARREAEVESAKRSPEDSHLRSCAEIVGYHIQAKDGEIGHVVDFGVEADSWRIREMIIDTRNWLPGKQVRVEPKTIRRIEWRERKVHVSLPRETIRNTLEPAA
jgi:sporulation protein YlmC with PRC-barrel domain